MAAQKERTVELLCGAFATDLQERRVFSVENHDGEKIVDLYFKPITRAVRIRALEKAGSDNALKASTIMMCLAAELEDGTRAFHEGDALKLQRELPEKVLDSIELFLHEVQGDEEIEEAKND